MGVVGHSSLRVISSVRLLDISLAGVSKYRRSPQMTADGRRVSLVAGAICYRRESISLDVNAIFLQ